MHICHVITRLIIGGAQENTLLSCEGLHERGHRVTLVSGPTRGPEGSLVSRARAGGYEFIEIPELIRPINPWMDIRAARVLRDLFERLRPDVVHTHSSKAGIVGRHAAHAARVPHIVHTVHGMAFNRTQPWPLRTLAAWAERRASRLTDRIVTVADAMIEQSVAARIAPRARLCTIYSGMETERFDPAAHDRAATRRTWGVAADDVVVITVARLFRNKGYERLLPILARAAAAAPRLRFVWVGDGAQRGVYEAELTRLGLCDRATLTGLVPPEDVPRLLAGADILAHASLWEGLPRAVVQGLLMEVPAVAFALDGAPEVVLDNQTGRLIPFGDDDAFAAALVELAGDAAWRRTLGAAGRRLCLERFDWRAMVAWSGCTTSWRQGRAPERMAESP
jgi:glycosyltransferase involved in cell wall biosynthesis